MNKVALDADVVTVLCGSSCAASQETEILGEDAGLQVDATDAISVDRQARLLNVDRRDEPTCAGMFRRQR